MTYLAAKTWKEIEADRTARDAMVTEGLRELRKAEEADNADPHAETAAELHRLHWIEEVKSLPRYDVTLHFSGDVVKGGRRVTAWCHASSEQEAIDIVWDEAHWNWNGSYGHCSASAKRRG